MATENQGRGCWFVLLMGALAVPVGAFLAWSVFFVLDSVFGVDISLDTAFGVIGLTGLASGPAVVALLRWRSRPRVVAGSVPRGDVARGGGS